PPHHSLLPLHDALPICALSYVNLEPGKPIIGTPIDVAFIGSCTNARLSDLQAAARVVEGRKVAATVRALVVPGSTSVKRRAEAEDRKSTRLDSSHLVIS